MGTVGSTRTTVTVTVTVQRLLDLDHDQAHRQEGGREGGFANFTPKSVHVYGPCHVAPCLRHRAAGRFGAETVTVPARAERCGDHSRGEPCQCVSGQVSVLSELAFLVA